MTAKMKWRTLKHKLTKPLKFLKITWCDWCDTLCFNPYITKHDEDVCRHCKDDASTCECCEEITHCDGSVDMPWGWYCQDCYDDTYG